MDIRMLQERMSELGKDIETVLRESGYLETRDLSSVTWNRGDPDENMLYTQFGSLLTHLDFVCVVLGYLRKPVTHEGVICVGEDGRYELDGIKLGEGDPFEVLEEEDPEGGRRWRPASFRAGRSYEGRTARLRGDK